MKERPLLLLSNDDGVNAKGIQELIKALRPVADLIVVAPDGPRSGASGSITSETPLRHTLIKQEPGLIIYKCTGTPVDCVKLALHTLMPRTHAPDAAFTPCLPYVRRITEEVLNNRLPKGICLNVNFPDTKELKGVRICRQTDGVWIHEFEKAEHPRGGNYYWLTGSYQNNEPEAEDTDHWALDHGYAAITPTQIDVTAYTLLDKLNHWNWEV